MSGLTRYMITLRGLEDVSNANFLKGICTSPRSDNKLEDDSGWVQEYKVSGSLSAKALS
jgi:hypothetical protein